MNELLAHLRFKNDHLSLDSVMAIEYLQKQLAECQADRDAYAREYAAKVLERIMDDDYISASARSWLVETARCLRSGEWNP